ncbi:MAG: hypothetical protein V3V60_07830 [Sphingomonas aquatilis]|jgi:hypothetical protein|uniref:hypothetical protein n=1 Tax=Sphingomonas aquatilis TaxID=93063 RepID=UPI002F33DE24
MNVLGRRLIALEQAHPSSMTRWHCLRRYEDKTDADAVAAYEAEHGPIGDGNVIMRVIVSKPGGRPK